MKKNKRFILILTLCFFLLSLTSVSIVFAQGLTETQSNLTQGTIIAGSKDLPTYIVNIYRVGVGIVAILAVVVIMWGGLLWIMAGGNTGQIDNAKQWISGAVLGLFIALTSYVILNTINPQLTNLSVTTPVGINSTPINPQTICCAGSDGKPISINTTFNKKCVDYNLNSSNECATGFWSENQCPFTSYPVANDLCFAVPKPKPWSICCRPN